MSKSLMQSVDLKMQILFAAVLLLYLSIPIFLNPLLDLNEEAGNVLLLSSAQALPADIEQEDLPQYAEQWVDIELPLHWRGQFGDSRAVWYRIEISAADLIQVGATGGETARVETAESALAIYLWRINQTADFWLNGVSIGSGGSTGEPMARYWNTPLYFSIPKNLIQAQNELLIKHYAHSGWGSMEPPALGSVSALRPVYEWRYFIQHDVALSLFVFVLVTGGLSFMIWSYRRQESEYFWFAIASIGLSIYCLNQFVRYLPVSPDMWRWLTNIAVDLWAVASFIFLLRSLKLSKPISERIAIAYLVLGIPIYFYASFWHVFDINIYFHIGSVLIGCYGFYVCVNNYLQTGKLLPAFFCFIVILATIAGVHDFLMQAALNNGWVNQYFPSFENHFNYIHFAAPLIFLLIAVNLMKRFVLSMNATDHMNEQLEMRVAEAREELSGYYTAMETVMKRQSAQEERERIYRDLHDDVGSKLLSLFYRLDKEADSFLAKSALEDLRDIVSQKSLEGCTLQEAVAQWRAEVEDRVKDAGISLDWQCDNRLTGYELTEMQRTQLRRMIREVISNALLHSDPLSCIRVSINLEDEKLLVCVDNDGVFTPVSNWQVGRGISNLRVRARDLQGSFELVELAGNWVRACWKVPMNGTSVDARAAATNI